MQGGFLNHEVTDLAPKARNITHNVERNIDARGSSVFNVQVQVASEEQCPYCFILLKHILSKISPYGYCGSRYQIRQRKDIGKGTEEVEEEEEKEEEEKEEKEQE